MEIIDSLREFAGLMTDEDSAMRARFDKLADNIVTEHGKELRKQYDRGYSAGYDAGYDVGFASADDWLADNEDALAAHGWVKLPVDADGEVIHFGDVLDQFGTPMTVFAMSDPDPDQGDCMLELITDGISDGTWVRARKMRHHHAPTVEDVLREFTHAILNQKACYREQNIAEYAAKLRLKEEA